MVVRFPFHFKRELKQGRRRKQRERHLRLRVSAIRLFQVFWLAKCLLSILELNWREGFESLKGKMKICRHVLTSPTWLQNRSFHAVKRSRTSLPLRSKFTCSLCSLKQVNAPNDIFLCSLVPSKPLGDPQGWLKSKRRKTIFDGVKLGPIDFTGSSRKFSVPSDEIPVAHWLAKWRDLRLQ